LLMHLLINIFLLTSLINYQVCGIGLYVDMSMLCYVSFEHLC